MVNLQRFDLLISKSLIFSFIAFIRLYIICNFMALKSALLRRLQILILLIHSTFYPLNISRYSE
ncbi:hypothetical protein CFY87_09545 [Actinobacillus seminis]|uniref:Uncharacterized protein n=1 Tax=Actinobacillus seminis TaxID=722 RepID=A0ABX4FQU7_9PAST|nr:hypothetical protein CFY87_09545 [Actinobacillus seminis]